MRLTQGFLEPGEPFFQRVRLQSRFHLAQVVRVQQGRKLLLQLFVKVAGIRSRKIIPNIQQPGNGLQRLVHPVRHLPQHFGINRGRLHVQEKAVCLADLLERCHLLRDGRVAHGEHVRVILVQLQSPA